MQNVTCVRSAFFLGFVLAFLPVHATSPEEFLGAPPAKKPPVAAAAKPAPTAPPASTIKASNTPATSSPPQSTSQSAKPAPGKSATAKAPVALDTAKIHLVYLDGDFDQATKALENHFKAKLPMSHSDSIFAFKHLGVMYAANAATREKGRYYMYQLINIEPTAKILDMYASDMIYLIFRNVQEDYELRRNRNAKPVVAAEPAEPQPVAPVPAPAPVATAAPARSRTAYWLTGGAVLAVGTAGLLFILLDNPKPKTHTIVVAP